MTDTDSLIQNLQEELQKEKSDNVQLKNALSGSAYNSHDTNSIQYQFDVAELLGNLEHFLRGDYLAVDDQGNEDWMKPEDDELIIMNDYGVNSIMAILTPYLYRHNALSRYDVERINEILADLGDELTIFIYCNYEKMGLNNQYKKSRYGVIVLTILHAIESNYRRAILGKTSEDINTSKIYTESAYSPNPNSNNQFNSQKRGFNVFGKKIW